MDTSSRAVGRSSKPLAIFVALAGAKPREKNREGHPIGRVASAVPSQTLYRATQKHLSHF
jgi:hypothetical protein